MRQLKQLMYSGMNYHNHLSLSPFVPLTYHFNLKLHVHLCLLASSIKDITSSLPFEDNTSTFIPHGPFCILINLYCPFFNFNISLSTGHLLSAYRHPISSSENKTKQNKIPHLTLFLISTMILCLFFSLQFSFLMDRKWEKNSQYLPSLC